MCARSPTSTPRKAMSCWRRTCSGACSRGSTWAIRRRNGRRRSSSSRSSTSMPASRTSRPRAGAARPAGMHRQGRRARPLPGRQARLSGGGARRRRLRGRLLRRRHRRPSQREGQDPLPDGAALRRRGQVLPEGSAGPDQGRLRQPRRMSRSMSIPGQDHAFARTMGDHLQQAGGEHGAFALDRAVPPRDGAEIRSLRRCGTSIANTSSAPATWRRP